MELSRLYRDLASEVGAIQPPAELGDLHGELVAAIEALATQFDSFHTGVSAPLAAAASYEAFAQLMDVDPDLRAVAAPYEAATLGSRQAICALADWAQREGIEQTLQVECPSAGDRVEETGHNEDEISVDPADVVPPDPDRAASGEGDGSADGDQR